MNVIFALFVSLICGGLFLGAVGEFRPYGDLRETRCIVGKSPPKPVSFAIDETLPAAIDVFPINETVRGQVAKGTLFAQSRPFGMFHFFPPLGGCMHRVRTSKTAAEHDCTAATNGGFFDMKTGACIGNLVTDGKIVQDPGCLNANFGVTKDARYLMGYFSKEEVTSNDFSELIAGVSWLVRDGKGFVNESVDFEELNPGFVKEMAPRVAIGHDRKGVLLTLVIDGNEVLKEGLDLYMFEEICLRLGFVNAVNLDGGGSATAFYKGKVINHPSDPTGERNVTSITCML